MEAFVLVNTERGILWQALEAVLKVEGVITAYGVTGQVDAVVLIRFSDIDELGKIVDRIHRVKGVLRTQTLIAIAAPVTPARVMPTLSEEERTGTNGYSDR